MYIAKSDFTAYSASTTIPDTEFAELAERASEVIDELTSQRIVLAGGLSTYAATTQAAVKKAVCAQLQMMYAQGGVDAVIGMSGSDVQSASVGKFSYSMAKPRQTVNGVPVSPLVNGYLWPTGLLYRGVTPV
jgi:hypothetical protein